MRPFRPLVLAAAAVTSFGLALPATAAASAPAAAAGGLSAKTIAQIDAIAAAKRGLSATQKKVDSRLLTEVTQRRGAAVAAGVGRVTTGVTTDKNGRTAVNVLGDAKAAGAAVLAVGGRVISTSAREGAVRADVPLSAVETLAAKPGVSRVRVADQAVTARQLVPGAAKTAPLSKEQREGILRQRVSDALAKAKADGRAVKATATGPVAQVGAVTSEGDVTHAADAARARYKVTGTGVTIGVLSDGVDSLAASIASGDLPADTEVLTGQAGEGDEGTAMLEIVHDLAPGAHLQFATAFTSAESFADNIRALRTAGADIIVDDIIYFAESPFQDGPIAQAVIDVTDDGALYFSSAGNEQNVDDGTAGNWEGDYDSSGRTIGKFAGIAHDFATGAGTQVLNPVSTDSINVPAILQWNDPLGRSDNDYDLYTVAADGTVTGFSNDTQDGDDDAFEGFYIPSGTLGIAVVKFSGADRYFQITPFRGRFESRGGLTGYNTPGVTRGHSAVKAAFSVAAAPAAVAFGRDIAGVPSPSGPYPGVFTRAQQSETFTSDGPRRVFYNPDGTPITPGNLTSTGGEVRLKPDITAADGVVTTVPGFDRFYGTSAAAPHAAAIAGLILSGNPGISPAEVRTALTSTALDIEQRGYDRNTGYGIVMANRALAYTGATPQPLAVADDAEVLSTTDGDLFVEPGESAQVSIPVTNRGDGVATGVSVQVTTTAAGVTIRPASRSYGTIRPGVTKTVSPFTVTVPASWPLGTPVNLQIRVTFAGALSPRTTTEPIVIGQPSAPEAFSYTGPAVPIPDASTAGVGVPVTVSGVGTLSGATFSIDGSACSTATGATTVGLDHTFVGDLVGTLTAPDGTTVSLFDRRGSGGNNFCQTVFDDAAAEPISAAASTDAPFSQAWRPESPLSALVAHPGDGTWTFTVSDRAGADTGSVRAFTLHLAGFEGA
jgi:subtilisin-like proprotein convertase family protein